MRLVKQRWMAVSLALCVMPGSQAGEQRVPSLEMLEFLADWSAEDQAWLDDSVEQEQDGDPRSVEVNEDE